jgi:hypothetical protein
MDSRLVFRPCPSVMKPQGPRAATPACRLDMVRSYPVALSQGREKGMGEAATSVKATGAGLSGREKPGGEHVRHPYRKPTLVGRCESTKVGERTFVKELGNLTP